MNAAMAEIFEIPKNRGTYGAGTIVQRPGGRWQIRFCDDAGRRRTETFSTEKRARRRLEHVRALRETGKLDPHEGHVKADALAEAYMVYARNSAPKSYDWIARMWRLHLGPFFGGKRAARVTTDDLQRYIAERLEAGAATSTVNRELAIFKAMFRQGSQADPPKVLRVPKFPEKLREPNPRSGFVTDEQHAALQSKCKHAWLRAFLAIGYNFGFRKGELLGLRCHQVDLKARTIHLLPGTTKNDLGRTVKMTAEVYELLSECVKGKKPTDAVFTWTDGRPVKDFRGAWSSLTQAAGVPDLFVHDFRRSAVRRMLRRGISKHVAKRISGHLTDSVFRQVRYC